MLFIKKQENLSKKFYSENSLGTTACACIIQVGSLRSPIQAHAVKRNQTEKRANKAVRKSRPR